MIHVTGKGNRLMAYQPWKPCHRVMCISLRRIGSEGHYLAHFTVTLAFHREES